jgi:hypothetical protein
MKKSTNDRLSHEEILSIFNYDSINGSLIWKISMPPKGKKGAIAGTICKNGYITIGIKGTRYYAHRLVWVHQTGSWPSEDIDHIDGNKSNNKLENLRAGTDSQNMQNLKKAHADNISGFLGVERKRHRWMARIMVSGKRLTLGTFDTPEEAHAAYLSAKRVLHSYNTL